MGCLRKRTVDTANADCRVVLETLRALGNVLRVITQSAGLGQGLGWLGPISLPFSVVMPAVLAGASRYVREQTGVSLNGWMEFVASASTQFEVGYDQPPSMLPFVLYACLRLLIDLTLAPLRDRAADQAELLVLRHQVRVLERQVKVVRWRLADRLILAALARQLPRPSWSTLLVKPETVLRPGWAPSGRTTTRRTFFCGFSSDTTC